MQMKHLLIAFIVLLTLVGTASAAVSKVEIRSSIIHYDEDRDNTNGFGVAGDGLETVYINAESWAGLYLNLNSGVHTEKFELDYGSSDSKIDIYYATKPMFQTYKFNWGRDAADDTYGFAVIGFFAEPYVALSNRNTTLPKMGGDVNASKIAPLVTNDNTKHTLKTSSSLELGSGYSILVDQIDVDGNKVYLRLFHDGKELNSSIVSTVGDKQSTAGSGGDWIYSRTVLNESSMQVMRVHVKEVFQGTESSLVEIDGIWMVDYLNAFEVKQDVNYGKFNCTTATKTELKYKAANITLAADQTLDLGKGIYVKTEKSFDYSDDTKDKFYFLKTYTEPGKYEVRSYVDYYHGGNGVAGYTYNFSNFAAFFYDIDKQIDTENMKLTVEGDNRVLKSGGLNPSGLTYTTEPDMITYKYGWKDDTPAAASEKYYIMGYFGEKYVPFNIINAHGTSTGMKADKMTQLVIDDNTKHTLKTGATLELGSGYTIVVDQIDVDGNKAYLKFFSDGKEVNSSIVNTKDNSDWIFRDKVLGESNVQILRIHVKDVFQGTQDSLVEIDGIWLMDYANASQIKVDDKVGIFKFKGVTPAGVLEFTLDSDFTIVSNMNKHIANNMYLKAADNSSTSGSRFYFYVAHEIEGGSNTGPSQPPEVPPEIPPEQPPANNTPPVNNTPTRPPAQNDEKSFLAKYMWYMIGAVLLILVIAGAAYYFMVMKKK